MKGSALAVAIVFVGVMVLINLILHPGSNPPATPGVTVPPTTPQPQQPVSTGRTITV